MLIKKQHNWNIKMARKAEKKETVESKRRVDTPGPEKLNRLNDKEELESAIELLPIGATSGKKVSKCSR